MTFIKHIPGDSLKPYIRSMMIIESKSGMENSILPDTSIVAAFRLKGTVQDKAQDQDHRLPPLVFSGLRKQPRIIHYAPDTATLLVNFTEGGAAPFFKTPMHEVFGQNIPLDDLLPRAELAMVFDQLAASTSHSQRIAYIEQFFKTRLTEPAPDLLIAAAVRRIRQENGQVKISQLIRDLHISKDPFEKRFRKLIGASPKQFASIVRFNHTIDHYHEKKSLTEVALEAGYYDQSHFIHDFKLFTGATPFRFFHQ